jgi:hypothetical protein
MQVLSSWCTEMNYRGTLIWHMCLPAHYPLVVDITIITLINCYVE